MFINTPILAVGHAGWINAAKMIDARQEVSQVAAEWPRSVAYGELSTPALSALQANQ
ncbi:hypothetical protein RCH20_001998 [Psychrobacter sp. PL15]|uniref:hypothetical protein n=1 Tax=unclassified Psychrobacter TaxID=196806 RepID=UPI001AE41F2B|nr:hypothetical protein [Psychrobacter sp. PL15]MEC5210918.1 hypothetical protein [Psychrobacter sp. PL15]